MKEALCLTPTPVTLRRRPFLQRAACAMQDLPHRFIFGHTLDNIESLQACLKSYFSTRLHMLFEPISLLTGDAL